MKSKLARLDNDIKNLAQILLPTGFFITSVGFWKIGKSDSSVDLIIVFIGLLFVFYGIRGISGINNREVDRVDSDGEASVRRHSEVLAALEKQAKEINGLKEDFKAIGKQIEELKKDIDDKNNREFK